MEESAPSPRPEPEPDRAEPPAQRGIGPILQRVKPFGGWLAGVVAAVVATVIGALLVPTNSEKKSDPDALPFTMVIDTRRPSGVGWMTARTLTESSQLPIYADDQDKWREDWERWVDRNAAVPASALVVTFTLQGTSAAEVTLTGLTVRVTERRPPITGTHVVEMGAGDTPYRFVTADLDTEPPSLSDYFDPFFGARLPESHRRPMRFPYQVSLSDAESFEVHGKAGACDCAFVIEIAWNALGRTGTTTIDDGGRPFRVAGTDAATHYCQSLGGFIGSEPGCRTL
ncbi:hypothetical protein [Nocardia sp. NPDC051832]|uniref:hypothetical protein n=1 Tax=Nocardia sp. NPDC051832 TaxID=3155673 RepID=UPI0034195EA8